MHRTAYPALSSSGTSRPPMYPDAPVTRQFSGDDMLPILQTVQILAYSYT
jgi:hypothetical protein